MARIVRIHDVEPVHVEPVEREDQLRSIRFGLGLQTSWSRMLWYLGAAIAIGLGINGLAILAPHIAHDGLSGTITTRVQGGRYTPPHDWTRSIPYDLAMNLGLILGGLALIAFVWYVAKGAAQWEELDDSSDSDW